jgi:hypothetical protein
MFQVKVYTLLSHLPSTTPLLEILVEDDASAAAASSQSTGLLQPASLILIVIKQ